MKMNIEQKWHGILKEVQKPGRYIGGEWNQIKKDPADVDVKIALAFPDVYEVGMSHLGQKILYHILNKIPGVAAERVFAPWMDFEEKLRDNGIFLYSLENKIPLHHFDIIGFSLLYELNNSNILTILNSGGIPLLSRDRTPDHPLVIAGGPAAFNPEPVADIFDALVIGDGEEVFPEIIEKYRYSKIKDRKERVKDWLSIPGVYVPSMYTPSQPENSWKMTVTPQDQAPVRIKKRVLESLKKKDFPQDIIVPNIGTIFNRVSVEAGRGCPQNCRFCQARQIYFPTRWKNPDDISAIVLGSVRSTGFEDASLAALSVGDYPRLSEVIEDLMRELSPEKVSLSLSALRPGMLTTEIAENILRVRKTGITLVPEAGTERLRKVINKDITENEIRQAVTNAFSSGWRKIKLYFMVGLPTETEKDIEGIIETVQEIVRLGYKELNKPPQINLSVSSFIPKPHTPFQWDRMEPEKSLAKKHRFIKSRLKKYKFIQFKDHSIKSSILEAVFSRGDRRLTSVLRRAWENGARFDGWGDCFDFSLWKEAFHLEGMDMQDYLSCIDQSAVLPWDHIDTGIKKSHLAEEWECSRKAVPTPKCSDRICSQCRGCSFPSFSRPETKAPEPSKMVWPPLGKKDQNPVHRYRSWYQKTAGARYFSHIDLSSILQRGLRRAGIKPVFTGGFHPKMQLSFPPALPLGMEGKKEVFEFKSHFVLPEHSEKTVNRFFPEGIRFLSVQKISSGEPSLTKSIRKLVYSIDLNTDPVQAALQKTANSSISEMMELIRRYHNQKDQAMLDKIEKNSSRNRIILTYSFQAGHGIRPQAVLEDVFSVSHPSFYLCREEIRLI